jgi:hypothetical protein
MNTVARDAQAAAPTAYDQRIALNEAVLDRYRAERSDRDARGASRRTSDRVIARLEAETALLRSWADRDAGASTP